MPQKVSIDYNKLCIMVLLASVIYNEYLAYFSYFASWPKLPIKKLQMGNLEEESAKDILKILYVADPQIQGYLNEGSTGPIKRWDIDRYLSKTFSWAMYAYEPQVVIFLGDLIDEGSEADKDDYLDYVKRFKNVYTIKNEERATTSYDSKTQAIFVPGDNDIGGEGSDRVTKEKVERFQKYFFSKPVYTFREKSSILEIIPVNALTEVGHKAIDVEFAGFPKRLEYNKEDKDKPIFRMLVSHLPIMPMQETLFGQQVLDVLNPSIIFSAHDHRGQDIIAKQTKKGIYDANFTIFSQKTLKMFDKHPTDQPGKADFYPIYLYSHDHGGKQDSNSNKPTQDKEEDESANIDKNILHEIVVPTCSYRMGVKEMSFGISVINLNSIRNTKEGKIELFYANLWLPSRFALLYVYLAALISSAAIFLVGRVQRFRRGRREYPGSWRSRRRSSSNSPSPHRRSSSRNNYSKLV